MADRRRDSRGPREEKQFEERVLTIDRVARVVKGGRRFRFRALVVVGDGKGRIGVGSSKGQDVTAAVSKATDVAKKNFVNVTIENGTLPHEQQARVSGANILIKPAAPGTGLIAGGAVRTLLEVAGYTDALSKSIGSSNKTNVSYATIEALKALKPRSEWHNAGEKKKTSKKSPATKPVKESK